MVRMYVVLAGSVVTAENFNSDGSVRVSTFTLQESIEFGSNAIVEKNTIDNKVHFKHNNDDYYVSKDDVFLR